MKKPVFFALIFLLFGFPATCFCQVVGEYNPAIETPIKVTSNFIDMSEANIHRDLFLRKFRRDGNGTDLSNELTKIPMFELYKLYEKSRDAMNADASCSGGFCITGLKISLGLEGNQAVHYLRPVYMKLKAGGTPQDSSTWNFEMKDVDALTYYHYQDGRMKPDTVPAAIDEYKNSIRIKRFKISMWYHKMKFLDDTGNWKNDTRDVIYSFKEFFAVYDGSFNETPGAPGRYSELIALQNSAAFFIRNISRSRIKHSVYIRAVTSKEHPEKNKQQLIIAPGDMKAADFAHLCPPSCNDISFVPRQQ